MTDTKIAWLLKDLLKAEVRLEELKEIYEMQEGDLRPVLDLIQKIKLSLIDDLYKEID